MAGAAFGSYRLLDRVGAGGMGEVWRALDTRKNREVALKLIRADAADDAGFVARFHREAELAARLSSPYIVPIHDYGHIEGQLFLDMALVEGVDLRMLLDRDGRLEPGRAVRLIGQVARALGVAHRAGLVHRDVKPSNVLVTDDDGEDHAYLIDFGVAKALEGTRLTQSGAIVGTLAYMAPERFAGDGDHRSDVYALSCLLYEVLTGDQPFPAASPPAMIYAHLHAPPPAVSTVVDVPTALDAVVGRGMAKDPHDRYASASELAAAARTALARPVGRAPLPPRQERPDAAPPGRSPQTGRGRLPQQPPERTGSHADQPVGARVDQRRSPPQLRADPTNPGLPVPIQHRRPTRRVLAVAGAALVLIGVIFGSAALWASNQYYVGVDGMQVTIFQGVRGSVLGVPLHTTRQHSDLTVDELTESDRSAVMGGIIVNSFDDARDLVSRLSDSVLAPCPVIAATPTPASAATEPAADPTVPTTPNTTPLPQPTPVPGVTCRPVG